MRSVTLTERKPPPTGVVIGPLSATPFALDRLEDVIGQRVSAVLFHHVRAGFLDVPLELDARGFEDAPRRFGQLGADAVAGNEGHGVGHGAPLYR